MTTIEHGKNKNFYMNLSSTTEFDRMKWRVGMIDFITAQPAVRLWKHFPDYTSLVDGKVVWNIQALEQDTDIGLTFKYNICRNAQDSNI